MDWLRFRNTHLQLPALFPLVIGDRQVDAVLDGRPRDLRDQAQRALERLLWFWPRVIEFYKAKIHHDLFQRFLPRQPDARFAVIYSIND